MKIHSTNQLTAFQAKQIMEIWNREYPDFLAFKEEIEFETYLTKLKNAQYHLAQIADKIVGWIVQFERDGAKWFVLMVTSAKQKSGIGSGLLANLQSESGELNGWVIPDEGYFKRNGRAYKSPIEFYIKEGFEVTDEQFENENFTAVRIRWTK